jgi:N6-L-threonylcarbamoyladenine synthase
MRFPRTLFDENNLDFSFSGLKTAVLYTVHGQDKSKPRQFPTGPLRADLAASFQQAVVDVLVEKAGRALKQTGLKRLAVGGGVAANRQLRTELQAMMNKMNGELFIPPLDLCTDNAAMAALAVEKWKRQEFAPLDLDAEPNLAFS